LVQNNEFKIDLKIIIFLSRGREILLLQPLELHGVVLRDAPHRVALALRPETFDDRAAAERAHLNAAARTAFHSQFNSTAREPDAAAVQAGHAMDDRGDAYVRLRQHLQQRRQLRVEICYLELLNHLQHPPPKLTIELHRSPKQSLRTRTHIHTRARAQRERERERDRERERESESVSANVAS
jgi:hypothetical protein